MAKVTKSHLKSIVKECLLEILSEGIGSSKSAGSKTTTLRRKRAEEKRLKEHREKFEVRIDDAVTNVTDDPVMQSILQDTARTTLQEQISNEGPGAAQPGVSSPGAPTGPGINLDSIFDGPNESWGKLAFDD
jgi:hypothetical protein